jgi:hypothetical protein
MKTATERVPIPPVLLAGPPAPGEPNTCST